MSRTFSTNCGSLENLKFSTRCGCNPKARQIRTMAVCESPVFSAISRVLQCVLLTGMDSSVWVTTSSTCASVIDRGAPRARLVEQPFEPANPKAFPPFTDRSPGEVQLLSGGAVTQSLGTRQHDASTHRERLDRLRAPSQHRQGTSCGSARPGPP